ncbi:MAG: TRAP transporter large permease [Alphaproteobacteria bacterium]|nr:TRAP transporter large permease [Alphaproteobacteria bacterium]
MVALLFGSFIVLMMLRVPIAMSIGGAVFIALFQAGFGDSLYIVPTQVLEGVDSPALLAVPFFIMAGVLMNEIGLTDRIFDFANALVGHFRAGLAQVNVLASMIFAGSSGTAVADIAGLGAMEVKAMRQHGYPADFAAALSICSALVGPLIPPSVPLVIYGFISGTSVARLFLGGILPGILLGLSLMVFNFLIARKRGFPRGEKATLRTVMITGWHGIAALVSPVVILGSITFGITTPTEGGVLACAYAVVLGAFYRTLTWERIWNALTHTMLISSVIMIIIGFSTVMGWLLAIERVPQELGAAVLFVTETKWVFLLLLIVFLLVIGCLIEPVPAKIILVPVLLPVVDQFGIDRVHFGLIITFALLIGLATPPMGLGLYIMTEISGESFEKVTKATLPLLIPLVITLLLVTFVPGVTLWIPDFVMGPDLNPPGNR